MSNAKRVAVNTSYLYIRMALTMFISLYSTRLVLRALGVEDFGLFNVIAGAIAMLTFLNNGMTRASQRFMSYAQGEKQLSKQRNIFNVSVLLHLIIGFIIVLILEVTGYFLFESVLNIDEERMEVAKIIFQFMLVSTFFTIISVPYAAVINARENMLLVAIVGVIQTLLKLLIAIYITNTSYDKLVVYGLFTALASVFLLMIQAVFCHYKYEEVRINLRQYYDKPLFREMSSFAGWGLLGGSTSMLSNYGQGLVLNSFFGPVVNAAQGISNQVSGQLHNLAGSMQKALNPVIAKSEGAGDRKKMLRVSVMGSKISFFLLMILYVPVMLEMPFVFDIWLDEVPGYAIIFCKLLLVRRLVEQLYFTLTASVEAVGDVRLLQTYKSVLNVFPLIVAFFLFKSGYPPYSLYIVFIGYAVMDGCISLYFAKKICDLPVLDYLKNVVLRCAFSFMSVLLLSGIPLLLMEDGFLRLLFVTVISTTVFLIVVISVGFNKNERKTIFNLIQSIVQKIKAMGGKSNA